MPSLAASTLHRAAKLLLPPAPKASCPSHAKAIVLSIQRANVLAKEPFLNKGLNLVLLLGIDVWEHAYYLQDLLATIAFLNKGLNLVPLLGIDVWEHAYYLQVPLVTITFLNKGLNFCRSHS